MKTPNITQLKNTLQEGKAKYNLQDYEGALSLYTQVIQDLETYQQQESQITNLLAKAYQKRIFAKQKLGDFKSAEEDLKTIRNILHGCQ